MLVLKQSTAATVRVGPFVDATDGVTPETGVTLGAADQAELLKHTGATVSIAAATWAAITGCDGWYDLSLTTSHTDTVGMLTIVVQDSSVCRPVFLRAMVVAGSQYDSLYAGTDTIPITVIKSSIAGVLFTSSTAISPSDSTDLAEGPCSAIYVGGTGDVVVEIPNDGTGVAGQSRTTATFKAVPVGTVLPVRAARVKTASTATLMLALR